MIATLENEKIKKDVQILCSKDFSSEK